MQIVFVRKKIYQSVKERERERENVDLVSRVYESENVYVCLMREC